MSNLRKPRTTGEWTSLARRLRGTIEGKEATLWTAARDADPALTGQLRAATTDARNRRTLEATGLNATTVRVNQATLDQLRGHFLRILFGLADDSIAHCPHISLLSPVPAIAPVYRDRVDCDACFAVSQRPRLSKSQEEVCDLCRGYLAGDKVRIMLFEFGPITLIVRVCSACEQRLEMHRRVMLADEMFDSIETQVPN